jgi:hypothetical protein
MPHAPLLLSSPLGLQVLTIFVCLCASKYSLSFQLGDTWAEWKRKGEFIMDAAGSRIAFEEPPNELEVRSALFATPPVEWNRLPHFQDVTIRLIAQDGILGGASGELYLQGEAATSKIYLAQPLKGRQHHLFCSEFNAGAKELVEKSSSGAPSLPPGALYSRSRRMRPTFPYATTCSCCSTIERGRAETTQPSWWSISTRRCASVFASSVRTSSLPSSAHLATNVTLASWYAVSCHPNAPAMDLALSASALRVASERMWVPV